MAQATIVDRPNAANLPGRPDIVSVGTIVWLASELMFFAALFAIYFTIRTVATDLWATETKDLNLGFSTANTLVLVFSSVTCQMAVWRIERGQMGRLGGRLNFPKWGFREYFYLTFGLGAFFIGGQVFEYAELASEGHVLSANPYWSIFFVATGFHGLHVTGGLFAMLFVLGRTFMTSRLTHEQATSAIVVSYYWHFVDVVWIALWSTIYLVK